MAEEWNGDERRHDHNLLIEVHTLLKSHVENFEKHTIDDQIHFQRLYDKTGELKKYLYMAMGAFAAFEIALKFYKE